MYSGQHFRYIGVEMYKNGLVLNGWNFITGPNYQNSFDVKISDQFLFFKKKKLTIIYSILKWPTKLQVMLLQSVFIGKAQEVLSIFSTIPIIRRRINILNMASVLALFAICKPGTRYKGDVVKQHLSRQSAYISNLLSVKATTINS